MSVPQDYEAFLSLLKKRGVKFIIIGGMAGMVYSSSYVTHDLDICYARDRENLKRLVQTLRLANARLRGAPSDLPFILDEKTLEMGLNFTFDTDYGPFDMLGEVSGVGGYEEIAREARRAAVANVDAEVISLPQLIAAKKAAGRPKDKMLLLELEVILDAMKSVDKPKEKS